MQVGDDVIFVYDPGRDAPCLCGVRATVVRIAHVRLWPWQVRGVKISLRRPEDGKEVHRWVHPRRLIEAPRPEPAYSLCP